MLMMRWGSSEDTAYSCYGNEGGNAASPSSGEAALSAWYVTTLGRAEG